MSSERINIEGGYTPEGEPYARVSQEGEVISEVIGTGKNQRSASVVDQIGNYSVVRLTGKSEESLEKIRQEMKELGAQDYHIGADSPDVAESVVSGWSRGYEQNFNRAFRQKPSNN